MGWYVARNGKTKGPYDEAQLGQFIETSRIGPEDLIRAEGGDENWIRADKHPQFAVRFAATAVAPEAARSKRLQVPWHAIGAVGVVLLLFVAGALLWLSLQLHERTLASIDHATRRIDAVVAEIKASNAPAPFVSASRVHNNCYTDRTNVTCTFTNLSDAAVVTCGKGMLTQKAAPGVKLESVVMCTGKLQPAETRVVTAPWIGGFADDICNKETAFGKSLDFSKCSFDTEPVDVPGFQTLAGR